MLMVDFESASELETFLHVIYIHFLNAKQKLKETSIYDESCALLYRFVLNYLCQTGIAVFFCCISQLAPIKIVHVDILSKLNSPNSCVNKTKKEVEIDAKTPYIPIE